LRNMGFLIFFIVCLSTWPAYAVEIQASVDRNPVNLNESFQITFTASEQPDGSPDFTPLQENFDILNQQRSSNVSWVNGKSSRDERWIVTAMAKRTGEFIIPPVFFGADSSTPLKITITDKPQSTEKNDEIFLDVQAAPEKPYVQSQVLYTLRIYFRVQISQSRLSDLEIKDALVEQLGEDTTYRTQINGVEYGVLERKYAIFPQQSGLFTIAPLTLTTEVVSGRQPRFNGFFNRQISETRRVSSNAVTLNVSAVPQGFTGSNWLSAESLRLSETWSDDSLQSRVGEPLTRTLKLVAKGTSVGQLPELGGKVAIDGLKSYPDQPALNEEKQNDGLVAIREEKIAYIPSQAGDYTLPEVSIAWFNTKTQKTEIARLPAVTLHTLPAAGTMPAQATTKIEGEAVSPVAATVHEVDAGFWPWLAGFLGLGWLIHVIWLYRTKRPDAIKTKPETNNAVLPVERRLKKACKEKNAQLAREALLHWGSSRFNVHNLTALAAECQEPLATELRTLNQQLYADGSGAWDGEQLWKAYSSQNKALKPSQTSDSSALEPLFKL